VRGGEAVASAYWRWRLTWNLFAIYQLASSSVGMYQMTDAPFAEARHYCIRDHIVVEDGSLTGLLGSHLAAPSSLRRCFWTTKSRYFLARPLKTAASAQQKRELAAVIHLSGASSAKAFAHRGFHPIAG
jgi:hypothetical protein